MFVKGHPLLASKRQGLDPFRETQRHLTFLREVAPEKWV